MGEPSKKAEAEEYFKKLKDLADRRFISSYDIALSLLGLGKVDSAMEYFKKALNERDIWVSFLAVDPRFEFLHSNRDFRRLVRKMDINPEWLK